MWTSLIVAWSRIRTFLRPGNFDRELEEELQVHLEMAAEDKIRQGMTPDEARRMARVELGGLTQLREANRELRGLPWLETFWLDIKLSFRMLRKSWGLTLVGGLAMTIAITIGVGVFAALQMVFWPSLPLDEGDRLVVLQTWAEKAQRRHSTARLDFERWRESLRSVETLGAFQTVEHTLTADDGSTTAISVAEMTASGFQLARVPPLMGRTLIPNDAHPGARPVVVIGHDVWQTRFSARPDIVGETLSLSGVDALVVGIMPEDFAFPMNHSYWAPLHIGQQEELVSSEPKGAVFARLSPGYSLDDAQTELNMLGLSTSSTTDGDDHLRPRAVPYTFAFTGDFERGEIPWVIRILLFLVVLLLVPPCANIAILVYARTIARYEEFAARYALGASRSRIVIQLFIEVWVLASGAAIVALLLVSLAAARLRELVQQESKPPFWFDFSLSFQTVLFAACLAVIAAAIAGAIPALKATGRRMQSGLVGLGSHTGMQLGSTWTALVVIQVGLTLAVLPSAIEMGWGTLREGILGPGFAAEEYLTAQLSLEANALNPTSRKSEASALAERFADLQADLVRQLEAEPGVVGATFSLAPPGEGTWASIEVENLPPPPESIFATHIIQFNHVDAAYFDLFDISLLTGRGFEAGDYTPTQAVVVVNQTFVERHFGAQNPLGYRVRYPNRTETGAGLEPTWYEIVGVVADRPAHATHGTMYHPLLPGQIQPASLALRVNGLTASLAGRLRELVEATSPDLQIKEVWTLDQIYFDNQIGNNMGAGSLAIVTLSVLLLSAAGMYALMSFTVNQRQREIGIRSALGARPTQLMTGVLRRAFRQVGAGALTGAALAFVVDRYLPVELVGGWEIPGVIPAAALFMLVVCGLATAGPARRGLRVDPIAVLREG